MSKHKSADERKAIRPWIVVAIAAEAKRDDRQIWPGEPTADEAARRRNNIVMALLRPDNSKHHALADILDNCDPDFGRCHSAACPECSRLWQRSFVRMAKRFIRQHLERGEHELVALSIVMPGCAAPIGQPCRLSISNVQRRIKRLLRKVGVDLAIGGIDFSLNVQESGQFDPHWCVHAYIVVATKDRHRLRKELRPLLDTTNTVHRPLYISTFENVAKRLSYLVKVNFNRRFGHAEQRHKKNGELTTNRNVYKDRLLTAEKHELLLYLHEIGLAQRPIFHGAKPVIVKSKVRFEPVRVASRQSEKRA